MKFKLNSTTSNYLDYPEISDKLIECLERDFPDKLPRQKISEYELGVLVGRMDVIDKLKIEKDYNEKINVDDNDDDSEEEG